MRPAPDRERWQPLRLGLVDLFYYDQEEFAFRDGRLLLRGNNGTGKSKVLALTLPFLLDGDLSAHRVEPDADPKKRMEWNLLLGGEHPNDERLGYAWLEFGRRAADGPAFCTIGCGLKAVKGRGIAASWFFVTDQRVGDELALVDATGVALTADRLATAIGPHGVVHQRARDHRRAVDERLFGLGDRYGALIDLLIKIRAPQLSKRPDERGLSDALTGALPPLDHALVADAAEAFRALEEDGEQLAAMIEARDASARYLETYRAYARMATRRRAAPVRQRQSAFDALSRQLGEAEDQHADARAALERERGTQEALRAEASRLSARRDALRDDPDAANLRRASDDADKAAARNDEAQEAVDRAERRAEDLVERLAEAETEAREAFTELAAVDEEVAGRASTAGVTASLTADGDRARIDAAVTRRQGEIDRVRELLRRFDQAHAVLTSSRVATERVSAEHAEAAARRDGASQHLRDASASYARAVRAHLEGARELELPDSAAALAELDAWLSTVNGANPLVEAVSRAGREAARQLATTHAQATASADTARTTIGELEGEIEQLEAGAHPTPPPPHTRADRTGRPGAPLWQLVDFRDDLSAPDRAGIEAALEAGGILDGWVTPEGELLDPDGEDAFLDPAASPHAGPTLDDVLVPATGADVRPLLAAIGLGESEATVWVTRGGRFRNGILRGAWTKPAATFIGHAAREASRQAALADLRGRLAAARTHLAAIEARLTDLAARQTRLDRELGDLPPDEPVREADIGLASTTAALATVTQRLAEVQARERDANAEHESAAQTLHADAADLDLPSTEPELARVEAALNRLREVLAALWPAQARSARAERARSHAEQDAATAGREQAEAIERLLVARRRLAATVEHRDTLQATVGAAVAELERQLGDVERALAANESEQDSCQERLGEAQRAEGAADSRRSTLHEQLETATDDRIAAVGGLCRFASTGLIAVAVPDLAVPEGEWNLTQALRVAREIEHELSDDPDDDARYERLLRQVNDELTALGESLRRHGNDVSASLRDEGVVVEVTFQGRTTSLPALSAGLADEVLQRQELLDAREREILENHLVGEIASTLHELVAAAEQRVADTNAELAGRPTSTGMRLRLRWTPDSDGPEGLADARARLLRQTSDAWSDDDRAALGSFLQNQIRALRAQDPTGTWLEHLTRALDYRAWHRFTVERHQGGTWRPATGPASSGERVLAASIPLFAAASSYYNSAGNPHAPRLVMLDEVFAGVDDRARAQCLGLLAAFDLDVVMTSEREWGCYAEVPGLAIAQLSRVDGVAAVLVSRWVWDGAGSGPRPWDHATATV